MIKVIFFFKEDDRHCICDKCRSILQYKKEDIELKEFESGCSSYFHSFITCPQCKEMINAKV